MMFQHNAILKTIILCLSILSYYWQPANAVLLSYALVSFMAEDSGFNMAGLMLSFGAFMFPQSDILYAANILFALTDTLCSRQ